MPIKRTYRYTAGGQQYDIDDRDRTDFERDFPDASIRMYGGGDYYDIPIKDVDSFLRDFADGSFDVREDYQEDKPNEANGANKPNGDSAAELLSTGDGTNGQNLDGGTVERKDEEEERTYGNVLTKPVVVSAPYSGAPYSTQEYERQAIDKEQQELLKGQMTSEAEPQSTGKSPLEQGYDWNKEKYPTYEEYLQSPEYRQYELGKEETKRLSPYLQDVFADNIIPVLDKLDEEAKANVDEEVKKELEGSAFRGGDLGARFIAMGLDRAQAIERALDPEKVINGVMQQVEENPEIRQNIVNGITQYLGYDKQTTNAEEQDLYERLFDSFSKNGVDISAYRDVADFKTQMQDPEKRAAFFQNQVEDKLTTQDGRPLTEDMFSEMVAPRDLDIEELMVLNARCEQLQDYARSAIESMVYDELVKRNYPKSVIEEIARGVGDSLMGTLVSTLVEQGAGTNGLRRKIRQEASNRYQEGLPYWERNLVSGAKGGVSIMTDALPFAVSGSLSGFAVGQAFKLGAGAVGRNMVYSGIANRLMAAGGSKLMRLGTQGVKNILTSAGTFGGYGFSNSAMQQYANNGKVNWLQAVEAGVDESKMGALLGGLNIKWLNPTRRAAKIAEAGARFAAEDAAFTVSQAWDEIQALGKDPSDMKLWSDIAGKGLSNTALLLTLKANPTHLGQALGKVRDLFTDTQNKGIGLSKHHNAIMKAEGLGFGDMLNSLIGKSGADAAEIVQQYANNVANNDKIPQEAKKWVNYYLTGDYAKVNPIMGASMEDAGRGLKKLTYKDIDGNIVDEKLLPVKDAQKEYAEVQKEVLQNVTVALIQDSYAPTYHMSAIAAEVAEKNGIPFKDVVEAVTNPTPENQAIVNEFNFLSNKYAKEFSAEVVSKAEETVKRETGIDVASALRSRNKNAEQMKAIGRFDQILMAEQQKRMQIDQMAGNTRRAHDTGFYAKPAEFKPLTDAFERAYRALQEAGGYEALNALMSLEGKSVEDVVTFMNNFTIAGKSPEEMQQIRVLLEDAYEKSVQSKGIEDKRRAIIDNEVSKTEQALMPFRYVGQDGTYELRKAMFEGKEVYVQLPEADDYGNESELALILNEDGTKTQINRRLLKDVTLPVKWDTAMAEERAAQEAKWNADFDYFKKNTIEMPKDAKPEEPVGGDGEEAKDAAKALTSLHGGEGAKLTLDEAVINDWPKEDVESYIDAMDLSLQEAMKDYYNSITKGEKVELKNEVARREAEKLSGETAERKASQGEPESTGKPEGAEEETEPDYRAIGKEAAYEQIYEKSELEKDEADAFVANKLAEAQNALDELQKSKPAMGTDIKKYKQEVKAWAKAEDEAAKNLQYWKDMKDYADWQEELNAPEEVDTRNPEVVRAMHKMFSEGMPFGDIKKAIKQMDPALQDEAMEYFEQNKGRWQSERQRGGWDKANSALSAKLFEVADDVSTKEARVAAELMGKRFIWKTIGSGVSKLKGIEGELFANANQEAERKARIGWLNSRENGGQTVDEVAHDIWEALNSTYYNGELDSAEVKNIVLEYLMRYHSPEGMAKGVIEDIKRLQDEDLAKQEEFQRDQEEFERMKAKAKAEAEEQRLNNIKPIGTGDFGDMYDQFKGKPKEAIDFLLRKKGGEAIGALHHKDIGDIDLVWGKEGSGKSDGFGLAKLAKYHPEVLENLQDILDDMEVVSRSENRVNLESKTHQAAVRLTWNNEKKSWLLTAFEKKNSVLDNTTDTGETLKEGKQNDTATLPNTVSGDKGNENNPNAQGNGEKNDGADGANRPNGDDIVNSIKQKGEEARQKLEQKVSEEKAAGVKFLKTVHPKSGAKIYTKVVNGRELPSSYNEYKIAEKQGADVSGEEWYKAKRELWLLDKLRKQYPQLTDTEAVENALAGIEERLEANISKEEKTRLDSQLSALTTMTTLMNREAELRDIVENGVPKEDNEQPSLDAMRYKAGAEPGKTSDKKEIAEEASKVNTDPSDAQKEAGNYKKGHIKVNGFDISIENPKGSVRRGKDADGKEWETKMNNTYGYIRGTKGVDGDQIDVYLSDDPEDGYVFVIDQVDPKTGEFDEHKVMYGFSSAIEAADNYLANYEEGWQGLGAIYRVEPDEFKRWVNSSNRKTKPFGEYAGVDALGYSGIGRGVRTLSDSPLKGEGNEANGANEPNGQIREREVQKRAEAFQYETPEEYAEFDKSVPEMSDEELLAYMRADGNGDLNKAYHKSVYDEYDARHNDEYADMYKMYDEALGDDVDEEVLENMLAEVEKQGVDGGWANEDRTRLLAQADLLQERLQVIQNYQERLQEASDSPTLIEKRDINADENFDLMHSEAEKDALKLKTVETFEDYCKRNNIGKNDPEAMWYFHQKYGGDWNKLDALLGDMEEDAMATGYAVGRMVDSVGEGYAMLNLLKTIRPEDVLRYYDGVAEGFMEAERERRQRGEVTDKKMRIEQREIGDAMVSRLQQMGMDVSTDLAENRKMRKQAEADNSEEGKMRYFRTPAGKTYGFTYRGKIYLDPTKIDAELPVHEYAHPWCEAFRRLNPEGWGRIVDLMKGDADTWNFIKQLNPDLKEDSDIAEEMVAKYSGQKGKERAEAEYARMNGKDPDYKSKWNNIWANISKAIQDFWQQVGSFLNIKYDSPEQVYDQVVRDFANKVNPRKQVETYLKERDNDYMQAVESGDTEKAAEIFGEALREEIGNGMTPYISVGSYRDLQRLARGVKRRDPKVVAEVAEKMSPLIPKDAVLVPAPGHTGEATDMLDVVKALSERTGAPVADVLKGESRKSQFEAKKEGKPLSTKELGIKKVGELPEGKIPVIIDNVVDTGNTAEAAVKALGKGVVVSLADSADRYGHAVSLKSAAPVVTDKDGKVVPLSQRFDMNAGKRLNKPIYNEAEEALSPNRLRHEWLDKAEKHAKELGRKLGTNVNIIRDISEIPKGDTRRAIRSGRQILGWYDTATGEVYVYFPNITEFSQIDRTCVHEIVAHKGLRELLGGARFNKLCDAVYASMDDAAKERFSEYAGVERFEGRERERAMADEYMAKLSEKADLNNSAWKRIVAAVREFLREAGFDIKISDDDITDMLRRSYERLRRRNDGADGATEPNGQERANEIERMPGALVQGFGSAGTSLNQIPSGMKKIDWKPGTVNVDIGGGRFDTATAYMKVQGVENLVFDPFNRGAAHNKAVAEYVRDNKTDTATCHNVLNVIDSEGARENVILQAAKAIKPDGTAYFTVYEGDKSGEGRQTKSDSWQNNRPTRDYVSEIEKYFDDVTVKNNVITARKPKQTEKKSVWDFDGEYKGNDIRFNEDEKNVQKRDEDYANAVRDGYHKEVRKMVDDAAKAAGYTIHAYHGTGRADRVGNVFLPERATSGPMAFFTDNYTIARNYAESKRDTSISYDTDYDSYETQFRAKHKNTGKDYAIYDMWGFLPFDERRKIADMAKHVRFDWENNYDIIYDPETTNANGGWEYQVQSHRGNILKALNEQWLASGNLYGKENEYMKVLKLAGVTDALEKLGFEAPRYMDPEYRDEAVYDVFLKIENPFDTANADEDFIKGFEEYAEEHEDEYTEETADSDPWDKRNITAEDFAERLRNDIDEGWSQAWTSIPDVATAYLKSLGYDGVKDRGGKNGGEEHTVWVPFSGEQVKRSASETYDDNGKLIPLSERFNSKKNDIRYQGAGRGIIPSAPSEAERALRDGVVEQLRGMGIDVSMDDKDGQEILDKARGVKLSRGQKRALETVVPEDNSSFKATAVSSADGAKILQNLETFAKKSENLSQRQKKSLAEREEVNAENIRMQRAETPVFVSNAIKAVEDIKQEKATNRQWLAMLQKNGGLKAGEDKWLGLSDWLKSQEIPEDMDGKGGEVVLTKQEVLDYIKAHQIEVQDVNYAENLDVEKAIQEDIQDRIGNGKSLQELQEEIDEHAESADRYDKLGENPNVADLDEYLMEVMRQEYGDDFSIGYTIEDGEISYNIDPFEIDEDEYNRSIAGNDNKKINNMRLDYTTKGLKNKREIALVVPGIEPYHADDQIHFGDAGDGRAVAWIRFGDAELYHENKEHELAAAALYDFERRIEGKYGFDNPLSWDMNKLTPEEVREMNRLEWEYKDTPNKTKVDKVLVIDEIQSKRHQAAREQGGYYDEAETKRLYHEMEELQEKRMAIDERQRNLFKEIASSDEVKALLDEDGYVKPEAKEKYDEIVNNNPELKELQRQWIAYDQEVADARRKWQDSYDKIQPAPFEKNWHELAMKRMLRYAAENGYDKIAWTKGEQQADRYNLAKKIEDFYYKKNEDGTYDISAIGAARRSGYTDYSEFKFEHQTEQQLVELLGKDVAQKVIDGKGRKGYYHNGTDGWTTFKGKDLKMGGEGMKGFYDKMLPRFMDKYGKKWGVKTGEIDLPNLEKAGQKMWAVDVTPEMKESVMKGQPMFFKTSDGDVYGFTKDGKIYIDPKIATAETPVHEFGHLWAQALRIANREAWEYLSKQLTDKEGKNAGVYNYVKSLYPDLEGDELVEEVFVTFAGKRGAERLRQEQERMMKDANGLVEEAKVAKIFRTIREALKEFYTKARDLFAGKIAGIEEISAEDFADMMMSDLANGINRSKEMNVVSESSGIYLSKDGKETRFESLLFGEDEMRGEDLQGKPTSADIDPTQIRLRPLEPGETCNVERRYVENGMFSFTGREKIESADDVAYIFKQLETAAVENSFLALVKDGKPTIIHLGIGGYNRTYAPADLALVAAREIKPDKVYFVHNHPSGYLNASKDDMESLMDIRNMFGDDVVGPGIIINTTSGQYAEFGDYGNIRETALPEIVGNEVPVKVYNFSKQVFSNGWNPQEAFRVGSSLDVAEFVSSHRLGKHKKMSLLVLNNRCDLLGNVFLPWTKIKEADAKTIAEYIHQMGGTNGVLFGNFYHKGSGVRKLADKVKTYHVKLTDILHVDETETRSARDEGVYDASSVEYEVRRVNEAFDGMISELPNIPEKRAGESDKAYELRMKMWQRQLNINIDAQTNRADELGDEATQAIHNATDAIRNADPRQSLEGYDEPLINMIAREQAEKHRLEEARRVQKEKLRRREEDMSRGMILRNDLEDGFGIDLSKEGWKRTIKDEIRERRRTIETSNLEDAIFVHELKRQTTAEERKLIPYMLEGDVAIPPHLNDVIEKIRNWYDDIYNIMIEEGLFTGKQYKSYIDNYVTHIWDFSKSDPDAVATMRSYIRMSDPYTRSRIVKSLKDGLEMGLTPKYEDIADILLDYGHYATETIANRRLVKFMQTLNIEEIGKDGEPYYVPILIPADEKDSDYERVNNNALDDFKVHKKAVNDVNIIFGKQHWSDNKILQKIGQLYDTTGSVMKKINLSMSFFHHGALTETAVAMLGVPQFAKAVAKNMIWDAAVGRKGFEAAFYDEDATRDAVKHFVVLGATQDYQTKDVQRITGWIRELMTDKKIWGAKQAAIAADWVNKGMDTFLWNWMHDGYKIYSYKKIAKEIREKAAKNGWTNEQTERALDEAGQLVNDTFGGQYWDLLGQSPSSVKWFRRLLLSPDWTVSTIRQALSPFGVGRMYDDKKFTDQFKQLFTGGPEATRAKYAMIYWTNAALIWGTITNMLNAYMRMKDEEEENELAAQKRQEDPNYKSPYELVYPDGMKWYDYTLPGNTLGHQTHLFWGRYSDGSEMYLRWGKQFREMPELFFGREGFSFPGAALEKIAGKLNPMINTVVNIIGGVSVTGFKNPFMKDRVGLDKDLGRLYTLLSAFTPYSIPTEKEKDFVWASLVMPDSKGYTVYKARRDFETAIKSADLQMIEKIYDACVQNGLDPDDLYRTTYNSIQSEVRKEMLDSFNNVGDAIKFYDQTDDIVKRKQTKKYIEEQLGAQDYNQIEKGSFLRNIEEGTYDPDTTSTEYMRINTAQDLVEDWRLKKAMSGLEPWHHAYLHEHDGKPNRKNDPGKAYRDEHKEVDKWYEFNAAKKKMDAAKKELGKGKDAEVMEQIRAIRRAVLEE